MPNFFLRLGFAVFVVVVDSVVGASVAVVADNRDNLVPWSECFENGEEADSWT